MGQQQKQDEQKGESTRSPPPQHNKIGNAMNRFSSRDAMQNNEQTRQCFHESDGTINTKSNKQKSSGADQRKDMRCDEMRRDDMRQGVRKNSAKEAKRMECGDVKR